VLTPVEPSGAGLVYLPGARVEASAYAAKLETLVDDGLTVVIPHVPLNFAILETRSLAELEALAPGVERWYVGGHSLGGVRACQYAADAPDQVAGLILFGSYCSADLSETDVPVLTIAGENDGLSTPDKIADAAPLLPADARLVEILGAGHAQFGDYGLQPGDGVATATDAEVRDAITAAVEAFAGG
jgi:pimeloyl-ACP methyl ester carboxylesterase